METFSALLALYVGIHRSPVNSPHKGLWRGALMLSLICAWINGWVNNRETGDLLWRHPNAFDYFVQHLVLTNINIKDPQHWPLWGESTGERWIPLIKGQWCGKLFHGIITSLALIKASISLLFLKHWQHTKNRYQMGMDVLSIHRFNHWYFLGSSYLHFYNSFSAGN